jgi:hypothetical protein|nr:MAG TPA: hypothetical protein [Caudoviricetes sp.]
MKIKQNHLLKICLHLEYYKEDITDRYGVMLTDFAVDNDVLDNLTKKLYVTTLDKQIKMEQENKQLKDNWNKLKELLVEKQKQGLSVISTDYVLYSMTEIERGVSDDNN